MEKKVNYKGKTYTIKIEHNGTFYCLRCIESKSGSELIPYDYLRGTDIEKIKPLIIKVIENNRDLEIIEKWDGVL